MPEYGSSATLAMVVPSKGSPTARSPTMRPSAVGWPGDATTDLPSVSSSRTTSWPRGACMSPVFRTTPAIRCPSRSVVQMAMPTRMSWTGMSPNGVAIRTPETRQMGQLRCWPGSRRWMVTAPDRLTVPISRWLPRSEPVRVTSTSKL